MSYFSRDSVYSPRSKMKKLLSYLWVGLTTTFNIFLNAVTFGHYLWLEGRVRRGKFRNWARRFGYRPRRFVEPTTEGEIVKLVKNERRLRVFGAGHSFNHGIVTAGVLVSLDRYCGVVRKNRAKKQLTVKSGTRVRDVIKALFDEGLAFEALPSHDAQSIAGILSTDVHGTGRNWGFVSDSVVGLKLIDGNGTIHNLRPWNDLFRAAIGGIGAVGIILEVTLQGVERFRVEQKFRVSNLAYVKNNICRLLQQHEHFSLYLFPFTDVCQINTWNRTNRTKSFGGPFREFLSISIDALLAAWLGNLMAYTGLLPRLSSTAHSCKQGTDLVMESHRAFNRTIYHLHQELEFTAPCKATFGTCEQFIRLYEQIYRKSKLPYVLFEIRFTPDRHDRTLIGAGRKRLSTWIDLVCNDSIGFKEYYTEAEKLIKTINSNAGASVEVNGLRPHLGKYCETFDDADMQRLHGRDFMRFQLLRCLHDPQRKFENKFTRRLFGP